MLRGHVFKFQTFANEVFAHFINTFLQGHMGVTKGCELTNTISSVSIGTGYFCIVGRFLEIVGNETIEDITNTGYYRLICEIDLSKTNTTSTLNQAQIKLLRGTSTYPTLIQEDLDNGGIVYQYEFAQFRVTDNGITELVDKRTFLNLSSIYTLITNDFEALFDAKSDAADELLQAIQEELASIEDRSGLLTKNGGIITGDLEVLGSIETDTLRNSSGGKYLNCDNICVLHGDKTLVANSSSSGMEYAQTTWDINYPTGFNKNNCIVLAFQGNLDKNERVGAYGVSPNTATNSSIGTLPRTVMMKNDIINLQVWNPAYSEKTYHYKLVLMKLPEVDITGFELGDINMNRQVTEADYNLMTGYIAGNNVFTDKQFKLADMNADGVINSADIALLVNKIQDNS